MRTEKKKEGIEYALHHLLFSRRLGSLSNGHVFKFMMSGFRDYQDVNHNFIKLRINYILLYNTT